MFMLATMVIKIILLGIYNLLQFIDVFLYTLIDVANHRFTTSYELYKNLDPTQ